MDRTEDYRFDLPPELIAQEPLKNRSDARLMVVHRGRGTIHHSTMHELPVWLREGDILVLNDSRVIPARLVGRRERTGGRWEGLFLESEEHGIWRLLGKSRGKMLAGETIVLMDRMARDVLTLRLIEKLEGGQWLAKPNTSETVFALLERIGRVPLPHYIRGGEMLPADVEAYQTVYASVPGSVAAPTAGLHFTVELLRHLTRLGVSQATVTLHVGIGTFRPITTERIEDHRLHAEWGSITAEAADAITRTRREGGRVVAVGTTSCRLLESAWGSHGLSAWRGTTDLYIRPPFEFRAVDILLTNFHLPCSTLLVLVSTFGGDALIRRAYQEAIDQRYRFYSYGDAMLIT